MKSHPILSVVICAYNRAEFLYKSLTALNNQTANKNVYQVIVVDNNSTDNTKQICLQFIKDNPDFHLKYYTETKQGLSFARNKGIEVSDTELISYIDDDGIAREDYVENLLKAFEENSKYSALGGKVEPIYENGKEPLWMSKYVFGIVSKVDYGNKQKKFPKKFPVGCNMAFKKDILIKIGGFNTDLVYRGDEKYVFLKLNKANVKTLYAPNVFVNHFIETFRTSPEHVNKVSKSIGASEKLRLQTEPWFKTVFKFCEYIYKFTGAVILYFLFFLKRQPLKGKYCVKVMYYTILGFFKENKFSQL
ncbi:MAG: glycosyltransferase [Bacteroidales bacterium]|nr:glycosyltransferase [Bacteroidales bacterium]